ncbi:MAG: hypothetical protein AAGA56_28740 [Myxococcota bacterium]
MSTTPGESASILGELKHVLGPRLVAVYRFGIPTEAAGVAGGQQLLVLVDAFDRELLRRLRELSQKARKVDTGLQVSRTADVLRGADVFPLVVLDLIDSVELLAGSDVLRSLSVDTSDLRRRIEHGFRTMHRDLVRSMLEAEGKTALALDLRRQAREAMGLLRALFMLVRAPDDDSSTMARTIEVVTSRLKLAPEPWHELRKLAAYELRLDEDGLGELAMRALAAVDEIIEMVDGLHAER